MPRAPRRCPGGNGNCTNPIRNTRYCPDHTEAWKGERTGSSRVTSDRRWKEKVRPQVLQDAGYQCQIQFPGICIGYATTVDKIQPAPLAVQTPRTSRRTGRRHATHATSTRPFNPGARPTGRGTSQRALSSQAPTGPNRRRSSSDLNPLYMGWIVR